ncbi:5'-methylthioadenosine/S-adenosylhomocysteine nucleosidase [Bacillus piscicola]|uniref:5'-methylthioadenosine/S-adenosylhomocysteine nucleosidase n=1 Tax=Bacillus piscicola TaxID=1632684 RepID=UPI001F0906F7|nr:5'-methylthioadenosine/S-adenosylhomocysteine nucleosidase [Bacillus piscicola]
MKIAIIGAMDEEVEMLKSKLDNRKDEEIGGSFFHIGDIGGQETILCKSGIGKVNAAISTTLVLERYKPDVVINTGSAGGFDTELNVGDLVISTEVRYNDVDATVFGYEFGQVPQMPAAFTADKNLIEVAKSSAATGEIPATEGLIVSGDSFMSDETKVNSLKEIFELAKCAEMEAGAIAHVCHRFNVPFVVIRALSDIAGKEAKLSYEQFLEKASVNAANLILQMVSQLKNS